VACDDEAMARWLTDGNEATTLPGAQDDAFDEITVNFSGPTAG